MSVLLDELLERQDARFLPEVLRTTSQGALVSLGKRWLDDKRPWSRAQLLAYVDDGCDRHGHRGLVKLLVRECELRKDDELLAHLLAAFDRSIEYKAVQSWDGVRLRLVTDAVFRSKRRLRRWDSKHGKLVFAGTENVVGENADRFSIATRRYIQRRLVRVMRKIKDGDRFRRAACVALALYEDAHFSDGAKILDRRGFLEITHHHSAVLKRWPHRFDVAAGKTVADLVPAPMHPGAWTGDAATADLLRLVVNAKALFVRRFAAALLNARAVSLASLIPLLTSPHADVQTLGLHLLDKVSGDDTINVSLWVSLLENAGIHAAPAVAALAARKLDAAKLTTHDLVRLARVRAAPVALLAARWLLEKSAPLGDVLRALDAHVEAVRMLLAPRALAEVDAAQLRDIVDRQHADLRALACRAISENKRFRDDPALWAALSESPFSDVQRFFVAHLGERHALLPAGSIERIWTTTLLALLGGSRAKQKVCRDVAARIVAQPEQAPALLPLLSIALRSLRAGERRASLASVTSAALSSPELMDSVRAHFPELTIPDAPEIHA